MKCSISNLAFIAWLGLSLQPEDMCAQLRDSSLNQGYHVNYWISVPVVVGATAANGPGLARIRDKTILTPAHLSQRDASDVAWFDRIALRQNTDRYIKAERSSDIGITWGTLLPAALIFADRRMRQDWLDIAIVYLEAQTITSNVYAWSFLGPTFIERFRPITYYDDVPLDERLWGGNRNSWYSGHVSVTTVTTFFMAQSYLDYHPEQRHLRWLYYGLATIPPTIIGVKRVQALKHFPSDVVAGFVVGVAGGTLIPKLHRSSRTKGMSLGLTFEPDWKVVSCVWKL